MNNFLNVMSEVEKKEQELFKSNVTKIAGIVNEFLDAFIGVCDTKFTNTEYVIKVTPNYSSNAKQYIEFVAYPEILLVLFHKNGKISYCDIQDFKKISENVLSMGFLRKI